MAPNTRSTADAQRTTSEPESAGQEPAGGGATAQQANVQGLVDLAKGLPADELQQVLATLGAQTPTRPDTDDAAVQPPPRGRPAAEQPAGSGAPARAGGGADIDEEIADGFEEEGLDDPDEYEGYGYRNSMAMRATDVGSLFSGGALPVAYDLDNPYPRPRQLQSFASHYKPSAAGDFASAEIYNKLGSANQREMCTLVPLASYLHDTHTCLARLVDDIRLVLTDADSAPTRRDFVDVLAEVRTLAKQSETLFEFTTQRVDELEALSRSQLDAAEFDPLYGNERSQSGARSALGETLQRSRTANRHRRIGGAIAGTAWGLQTRPCPRECQVTSSGCARRLAATSRSISTCHGSNAARAAAN